MSAPCSCDTTDKLFFCQRHRCEKTEHWHGLCQKREDYRALWDRDQGPGQQIGLRCPHRGDFNTCKICPSVNPATPAEERPGTSEFQIGKQLISIREEKDDSRCVWPGSLILAETLLENPPTGSVIDVGSGTGIVGIAAMLAGCHVTFLDRDKESLQLAIENAQANGLTRYDVRNVDWGDAIDGTWDNVFAGEVLWVSNEQPRFTRWLALHWSMSGVCRIAHSGGSLNQEIFMLAALQAEKRERDAIIHGKVYGTAIYEVTA